MPGLAQEDSHLSGGRYCRCEVETQHSVDLFCLSCGGKKIISADPTSNEVIRAAASRAGQRLATSASFEFTTETGSIRCRPAK
mgnify:CR=1 FL=1